ncbi:TonB-dependent receptor [Sphingomonas sp.]|uniref:TonB-dependent receptor n=1 Tax=Sphingomonas sp. TaxID=28214 RepID=UPI002DD6B6BC|nr:TonB-dependent receptor [Sphingomonas sp.]
MGEPSVSIANSKTAMLRLLMLGGAFVATPALAQDATDQTTESGEVVVHGRRTSEASEAIGEDKVSNTVAITREALLSAPAGISGLKMLESLPGFNVQTEGSLGLYEFGNSVQVRAFNLDQIGFIVDGIPTGRSDPFGGSPVFRYVDNENLAVVEASPGAGGVSLPSYASLGPIVQYKSIAPQEDLGLFVGQTFGEYGVRRTFVRASSGRVGPLRGYVSYTKLSSDLWRGAGTIDRKHWEAQLIADLGRDSWLRFKFVSNDFFDYDSPTLSRADYLSTTPDAGGKLGRWRGYIGTLPSYPPLATAPGVAFSDPRYAYYYGTAVNIRNDRLYGTTLHVGVAPGVTWETTGYWEDKDGYGVSPDTYTNSLTNYQRQIAVGQAVVAPRGSQYGLSEVGGDRFGITSRLEWKAGAHTIQAGIWAELDKYHRTQLRYNLTGGSPAGEVLWNEVVFRRRDYRSKRETTQLFLRDTISLADDRLVLDLGVKSLSLDYQQRGYRDFNDYARLVGGVALPGWGPQFNSAHYSDHSLPTAGLLYRLSSRTQVFVSYAENYALPKGLDDIFSVALNSSAAKVPAPAPERARNFELGIRTNQSQFFASLAGYYTAFENRIQSVAGILPGTTNVVETFFQNVGRARAYGLELTGTFKPSALNGLAYFSANATYNNAKFQDDIPNVAALSGKYLPDSAKWIVAGGVTVEPASWLVANISGRYTSQRHANFVNTFSVPGFTVFNAYVDIGDGFRLGPVKNVRARLNIDNLFDKDTLSFISPQLTADGLFRPLAPRTVQFTLSTEL